MECGVTDNSPSESCVTSDVQTTAAQYADSCTVVRVAGTQTIPLEGSNNGNSITMSFVKFSVCKPRTKSNDNCYPCNDNMAVVVDAEMSTSKSSQRKLLVDPPSSESVSSEKVSSEVSAALSSGDPDDLLSECPGVQATLSETCCTVKKVVLSCTVDGAGGGNCNDIPIAKTLASQIA